MYGEKFAFQNRLAQFVVGRKFTIFALFYFVFEGKFQEQASRGAYIRRGDLTEGFLRQDFGGLIFGGAYTWRGLFSEFYGTLFWQLSINNNIDVQSVFSWAPQLARKCESKHWLPCGADGRAVYGHVITKFSGMGRFTQLWGSAHARALCARVEFR